MLCVNCSVDVSSSGNVDFSVFQVLSFAFVIYQLQIISFFLSEVVP